MESKTKSSHSLPSSSVPQGTASVDVYSAEFIDSSSVVWRNYDSKIELNHDSVVEIIGNLNGYFELLKQWSEKDSDGTKKD
ncbi:MAG: hypothetical protein IPK68_22670 [Bdellovibrionales bacterium]|nr:hypothetical protein [Bdellovibrionales bacterium]